MLELFGLVVMFAAIAPICMAGGQMIAAFMLGRHMLVWTVLTAACMALVLGGAVLALKFGAPLLTSHSEWLAPIPAAMLLAPVWVVYFFGDQLIRTRSTK